MSDLPGGIHLYVLEFLVIYERKIDYNFLRSILFRIILFRMPWALCVWGASGKFIVLTVVSLCSWVTRKGTQRFFHGWSNLPMAVEASHSRLQPGPSCAVCVSLACPCSVPFVPLFSFTLVAGMSLSCTSQRPMAGGVGCSWFHMIVPASY